jgi:hypothetical protein
VSDAAVLFTNVVSGKLTPPFASMSALIADEVKNPPSPGLVTTVLPEPEAGMVGDPAVSGAIVLTTVAPCVAHWSMSWFTPIEHAPPEETESVAWH